MINVLDEEKHILVVMSGLGYCPIICPGDSQKSARDKGNSSSSVYSLRPNNLVQEEHIYNTYKYKSSEVQTNRYIFIQGKNINKKEQTIESLLMLDFSIKDHNRKTTKRSRQHQKFLK